MLDANPLVAIAAAAPTAQEGSTPAQFTVTRTGDLSTSIDVNIGVGGTASSADYANITLPVHFGVGEEQQTIYISPYDDRTNEGNETVSLTLLSGSGYDVDAYASDAAITIQDSPNQNPTADTDSYTVTAERGRTKATVNWSSYTPSLGNDTDPENDTLNLEGTWSGDSEEVDVGQTVSRSYTINDGYGGAATGTVSVTVLPGPANQNPTANDDTYTMTADRGRNTATVDWSQYAPSLGNDTDPENDPLAFDSGHGSFSGTEEVTVGQTVTRTYSINDGLGGTATGTVSVMVIAGPANQNPTANTDSYTVTADRGRNTATVDWSLFGPSLANDTDPEYDPLSFDPGHGSFSGTEEVMVGQTVTRSYSINDGLGGTATGTVSVTVSAGPANQNPTANTDSYTVTADRGKTKATVNWSSYTPSLGNDTDPENDTLTIEGTWAGDSEEVDVGQTVTRSYTINDGLGGTATGTVSVTVLAGPTNQNPTANTDAYTVTADRGRNTATVDWSQYAPSLANDTDPEYDPLAFDPGHGSFSGTEEVMVGQTVSRTYSINDGLGGTATGTVSVTVSAGPTNQNPTANSDAYTVTADRGRNTATVNWSLYTPSLGNDTDPENDTLNLEGSWSGDSEEVTVGQTVTRSYSINDGLGGTATGTVSVTVLAGPVNQNPTASTDAYTVTADRGATSAVVDWSLYAPSTGNDTDPENDTINIDAGSFNNAGTEIVAVGQTVSRSYTINDGLGGTATGTVSVTVLAGPTNQNPTAVDDVMATVTAPRGASGMYIDWSQYAPSTANDSDPENDTLSIISAPSGNQWVNAGETVYGAYTISDGYGGTASANVVLTVVADTSNQNPTANEDAYTVTAERGRNTATIDWSQYSPSLGNDTDPENDTLSFEPGHGSFSGTEEVTVGQTVTRSYSINDGYGGTASGTVSVTVLAGPTNQNPTANTDAYTVTAERGATSAVVDWSLYSPSTGNDTDPEYDTINIDAGSFNNAGTETVAVGQTVSRTYTINDGLGGTATGTVSVTVLDGPTNQNPTANTDTYTITADRGATSAEVDWSQYAPSLGNDTDPENDALSFDPGHGSFSGTEEVGVGQTVSRNYTINDGHGGTATGTVSVTVLAGPTNQNPIAVDDVHATIVVPPYASGTTIDWSLYVPSTGNDTDPENDTLTITSAPTGTEWVAVGQTVMRAYTISDGHGGSATANVVVSVEEAVSLSVSLGGDTTGVTGTAMSLTALGMVVTGNLNAASLTYEWNVTGPNGSSIASGTGSAISFTPTAGGAGNYTVNATVNSPDGKTASTSATVSVEEANRAPTDADATYTTEESIPLVAYLPDGEDLDGDTLTYLKVNDGANGVIDVSEGGGFIYTPNPGFYGTDSFTYKVNDGKVDSPAYTVTIYVIEKSTWTDSQLQYGYREVTNGYDVQLSAKDDTLDLDSAGVVSTGANILANDTAVAVRKYTAYYDSWIHYRTYQRQNGVDVLIDEHDGEISTTTVNQFEVLGNQVELTATIDQQPSFAASTPAFNVASTGEITYAQADQDGLVRDDRFSAKVRAEFEHNGILYSSESVTDCRLASDFGLTMTYGAYDGYLYQVPSTEVPVDLEATLAQAIAIDLNINIPSSIPFQSGRYKVAITSDGIPLAADANATTPLGELTITQEAMSLRFYAFPTTAGPFSIRAELVLAEAGSQGPIMAFCEVKDSLEQFSVNFFDGVKKFQSDAPVKITKVSAEAAIDALGYKQLQALLDKDIENYKLQNPNWTNDDEPLKYMMTAKSVLATGKTDMVTGLLDECFDRKVKKISVIAPKTDTPIYDGNRARELANLSANIRAYEDSGWAVRFPMKPEVKVSIGGYMKGLYDDYKKASTPEQRQAMIQRFTAELPEEIAKVIGEVSYTGDLQTPAGNIKVQFGITDLKSFSDYSQNQPFIRADFAGVVNKALFQTTGGKGVSSFEMSFGPDAERGGTTVLFQVEWKR